MGVFDKLKNLFTEEVEEEVEDVKEEPIKKKEMQVEIPAPVEEKKEKIIKTEVEEEIKVEPTIPKEEHRFPFFDDDDFSAMEPKEKKREEKRKPLYHEETKETKEAYNGGIVKEPKKVFKPSPIISPVYGILDKNYQKEEVKPRTRSYYDTKEITVDDIRNKAYGTLEDDIETTLFSEEDSKDGSLISDELSEEEVVEKRPRHESKEEEKVTLEEEPKEKKREEKPRKISDKELFSMIDSMYQKGDKND